MILLWISGIGVAAMHAAPTTTLATPRPTAVPITPGPARSPFAELAGHARNTLLSDPIVSAQLTQPPNQTEPETPWHKWLNEDVAYIITDGERGAFRQLTTDEERAQFVEQFWLRRDPTPVRWRTSIKKSITGVSPTPTSVFLPTCLDGKPIADASTSCLARRMK